MAHAAEVLMAGTDAGLLAKTVGYSAVLFLIVGKATHGQLKRVSHIGDLAGGSLDR